MLALNPGLLQNWLRHSYYIHPLLIIWFVGAVHPAGHVREESQPCRPCRQEAVHRCLPGNGQPSISKGTSVGNDYHYHCQTPYVRQWTLSSTPFYDVGILHRDLSFRHVVNRWTDSYFFLYREAKFCRGFQMPWYDLPHFSLLKECVSEA
jgi:hypothetical protein